MSFEVAQFRDGCQTGAVADKFLYDDWIALIIVQDWKEARFWPHPWSGFAIRGIMTFELTPRMARPDHG